MQAGRLDQFIRLTAPTRSRDAFGGTLEEEGVAVSTWASVRQQGAAERARNGVTVAENTYAIRIRHREGIDATYTIHYRDRSLAIVSVTEGGMNNREWLDIVATEASR